jgi:DNA-binding response OmpR family regulator
LENTTPPKRFLLVEDDVESCEMLRYILSDYDLTVAHTLASATPLFQNQHFDIFMLDNWLPDGSGIEFCRTVRTRFPDTPIIFASAAAMVHNLREAEEAGATRYIVKPYDPEMLQNVVKQLLST